jgi:predicted transposase YbfD/YdcC
VEESAEHGRIQKRTLSRADADSAKTGFPYAAQVFSIKREWTQKKTGQARSETRWFITSLSAGQADENRLLAEVRGHWSVENKNHWRRDSRAWEEDKCLHRKSAAAQNLAIIRNTLLAVIPGNKHGNLPDTLEYYRDHKAQAVALLKSTVFP